MSPLRKIVCSPRLELLHQENRSFNTVATILFFPLGAIHDPTGKCGLTNLALRNLLSGTSEHSAQDIAGTIEGMGASLSLDCRADYSLLTLQCTPEDWPYAMDLVIEIIYDSVMPGKLFRNERQTLQSEIREEKDSKFSSTFRLFQKEIFGSHPYGRPAVGLAPEVGKLTRDDALQRVAELIRHDHWLMSVVGKIPFQMAKNYAEILDLRLHNLTYQKPKSVVMPRVKGKSTKTSMICKRRKFEAEFIIQGYLAPPLSHPDYFALKVLDSIMGEGMNSRLFVEMREKRGLAYQVGSSYSAFQRGGYWMIYMGTSPQNHDQALELLTHEIKLLKTKLVPQAELKRALTYLRGVYQMSHETNMSRALMYGSCEHQRVGYQWAKDYPRQIAQVKAEDVQRVANKYLNHYTLAWQTPSRKK